MKQLKGYGLMLSYILIIIYTMLLLAGSAMSHINDYSLVAASDYIGITLWFLGVLFHHVLSYLYLKVNDGMVLYQGFYATLDMTFVFKCLSAQCYVLFMEWFIFIILGLRFISMFALMNLSCSMKQDR